MSDRPAPFTLPEDDVAAIDELRAAYGRLTTELKKIIVGQDHVVEQLAICLFARGHALLMGVPGLAKTLLISRLAETMSLSFNRIQFTPDLMPMDITGTDILQELPGGKREFQFAKGPVFANIVLADEINRAPSKTQAAMLEAMQEHRVTVAGRTYTSGRAVFRARHAKPHRTGRHLSAARGAVGPVHVHDRGGLSLARGGNRHRAEHDRHGLPKLEHVLNRRTGDRLSGSRAPGPGAGSSCTNWPWTSCAAPAPNAGEAPGWLKPLVSWGAGPRAVQYLILGAKTRAALRGSYVVRMEDVMEVADPVLRHRVMTTFTAESEGVSSRDVAKRLVEELAKAA